MRTHIQAKRRKTLSDLAEWVLFTFSAIYHNRLNHKIQIWQRKHRDNGIIYYSRLLFMQDLPISVEKLDFNEASIAGFMGVSCLSRKKIYLTNKHSNHVTLVVDALGKSFYNHKFPSPLLVSHVTSWEHAKSPTLTWLSALVDGAVELLTAVSQYEVIFICIRHDAPAPQAWCLNKHLEIICVYLGLLFIAICSGGSALVLSCPVIFALLSTMTAHPHGIHCSNHPNQSANKTDTFANKSMQECSNFSLFRYD